ncbi:unnamed protein product, partial [Thelazia callipaeda]|uniref:Uncharacterized protein n=1 Tax=Thelazia callipaeda TaxID=103827 RepID=A0A0N5CMQ7_THECL
MTLPLIIVEIECASQKKNPYGVTNSMRTTAVPPMMQGPLPPVQPVYAKNPQYTAAQSLQSGTPDLMPSTEPKENQMKNASKENKEEVTAGKEKDDGGGDGGGDG